MTDVLDTIRAVGYIAQLQLVDGTWVSWTQYTTHSGRTPEQARDLARTLARRKLEIDAEVVKAKGVSPMYVRGRVVRADWTVEEVLNPPATNPEAPRAGTEGVAKDAGLEAEVESGTRDER